MSNQSINKSNLVDKAPICHIKSIRGTMAETSQSVHCMQCQTVQSLACFIEISW